MTDAELMHLRDQIVHKVESQWHFPIMTRYGFTPETTEARGFVRHYWYVKGEHRIKVCSGVNADYWEAKDGGGYWAGLEPYLKEKHNVGV